MTRILRSPVMILCMTAIFTSCRKDYPIRPIPFTQVRFTDRFWLPRLETNRTVTLPTLFRMDEVTGRVDNLRKAAGMMEGPFSGRRFNDSDVFKAMEAAAYSLASHPDPVLENEMDALTGIIAAAQEEDGYLYAARTVDPDHPAPGAGAERWVHLQGSHELYNAGHLYEAAVAYFQATGKRALLDVALRNADLILNTFGPGKRLDTSGHQEIELGLVKLFRVTGNRRFLEEAEFFLDQRGRPHDHLPYPDTSAFAIYNDRAYRQDHLTVLEQTEAVGHAVRAAYQYAAMADVAALSGHAGYVRAIGRLWEDVVSGKLYLTGGIGARAVSEAFGEKYELPNASAYTETCAAVGNVFWNHRMFLLHGHGCYLDVMERTLYNGLLSGVSLEGDRFFYENPLESKGGYERSDWFACSCCPGNIARLLSSLPGYMYAVQGKTLYVALFAESEARLTMRGIPVELIQETRYPWDGKVTIRVKTARQGRWTMAVRVPGWAEGRPLESDLYRYMDPRSAPISWAVNGLNITPRLKKGFARIRRQWKDGDQVAVDFPMPVRTVAAHPSVPDDREKAAFERGPVVYCTEGVDHGGRVLDLQIAPGARPEPVFEEDLLGGVTVLKGEALRGNRKVPLSLVPYYAWAHRGPGEMTVWLKSRTP